MGKKLTYRGSAYTKFKKIKLKPEDEVICIAGKDKGKKGKILAVDKKRDRVIVTGINRIRKFVRPTQENPQGGAMEIERPIHISNVQFYDSKEKKGVRLGSKEMAKGKVRVTRPKSNEREI
ncbi:MAG: 50S ribosomal protein L24 [Leptospiraceae bacterium]|nr:50S ribosomal protein L24 [Leptospiraceae bacterium]MCP5501964.1 50S ribosomal protein L24 [Leptospiraceae bacterium]